MVAGNLGRSAFHFGTNLKMHQTPQQTLAFLDGLISDGCVSSERSQLFVIPPFTSLHGAASHPAHQHLWLGAQTMHWADSGPFTGEISPTMLAGIGVDLVLLGHAERRQLFHETDVMINKKALAAIRHHLRVLLCVGETAKERHLGISEATVLRQLELALDGLPGSGADLLMVAYEPIWSIGVTGRAAQPGEIRVVINAIHSFLQGRFGAESSIPILYGGSVDVNNCRAFAKMPGIDGLFVGRAAWTPAGFAAVLKAAESSRFGA